MYILTILFLVPTINFGEEIDTNGVCDRVRLYIYVSYYFDVIVGVL